MLFGAFSTAHGRKYDHEEETRLLWQIYVTVVDLVIILSECFMDQYWHLSNQEDFSRRVLKMIALDQTWLSNTEKPSNVSIAYNFPSSRPINVASVLIFATSLHLSLHWCKSAPIKRPQIAITVATKSCIHSGLSFLFLCLILFCDSFFFFASFLTERKCTGARQQKNDQKLFCLWFEKVDALIVVQNCSYRAARAHLTSIWNAVGRWRSHISFCIYAFSIARLEGGGDESDKSIKCG